MTHSGRRFPGRTFAAAAIACALVAGALTACNEAAQVVPPALPTTTPHQSGVPLPGGLVTRGPGQECAECHAEVVEAYGSSGMQQSLTLPSGEESVEARFVDTTVVDPTTGQRVALGVRDGHYIQRSMYVDPDGVERAHFETRVDLVVGSGHMTRSYFQVTEGRLFQLPVTWYASKDGMALSPGSGYRDNVIRYAPAICVGCHTGSVEPVDARREMGFRGTLSLGIDCDRCHGDGEIHVLTGAPEDVVHPARLDGARQSELCYQCHLSGAVSLVRAGETLTAYQPGTPLGAMLGIFDGSLPDDDPNGRASISGHARRLSLSRCATQSEDLTCTTCHNPHVGHGTAAEKRTTGGGCFVCHTADSCAEEHNARADRSCASCHMATRPSSDIEHTEITDHFIQRTPPPAKPAAPGPRPDRLGRLAAANAELTNQLDPNGALPGAKMLLARAYFSGADYLLGAHGDPSGYLGRARDLVRSVLAEEPDSVEARTLLGRILVLGNAGAEGRRVLDGLVAEGAGSPDVLIALALDAARAANPGRSEQLLRDAWKGYPFTEHIPRMLADGLWRAGRHADALDVLAAVRARLGPSLARAETSFRIAMEGGDAPRALEHAYDVLLFRPRDANALIAAADAAGRTGLPRSRSRALLKEALRIAPGHPGARAALDRLR